MSTGPLQARVAAAMARALKEPDYPVAQRPLDYARFAVARLVPLEFSREEVVRLAKGHGWTGYLSERGFNPDHAFDRHYRDGSMVVVLWVPAARGEGRPS